MTRQCWEKPVLVDLEGLANGCSCGFCIAQGQAKPEPD